MTWTVTSVLTEIGYIVTQGLAWAGSVVTFVMIDTSYKDYTARAMVFT